MQNLHTATTKPERLLTAEPWVEREVQLPLSGCNLGTIVEAWRSNHTHNSILPPIRSTEVEMD